MVVVHTEDVTHRARYAALVARDARFDGVFFVGVTTTGIYCRPICPARTPAAARCRFFTTPVAAEAAGFRACFRCRPELAPLNAGGENPSPGTRPRPYGAPGDAPVDAIDQLVAAAAQRIAEGALNERSLDTLARELDVSPRHLRRALTRRLGVSPVELAQSRRVALAKHLLQDTALPLAQVAFAAGFGSVRRFNAAFAARMGAAPSAVRRHTAGAQAGRRGGLIVLRLDYRPPYDWPRLVEFLRARAIPGVEIVDGDTYRRIAHVDGKVGVLELRPLPGRHALALGLAAELVPVAMPLVARVRRMFDLDARPDAIASALGHDRTLAPLVAARPGLRLPGALDPFEAAVRALLGQQVSVAAATTLAGRFAGALGTRVARHVDRSGSAGPRSTAERRRGEPIDDALAFRFPTAREVAAATPARIAALGMPETRARAIHELARAVATRTLRLDGPAELDAAVAALVAMRGIGPWTAHYLAMRALHLPDAFPAGDLGVQKALGSRGKAGERAAEARAEAWRPFRAYAVMHLWTHLSEGGSP